MKCDGYRVGGRVELTMQCYGTVCTRCSEDRIKPEID